MADVRALLKAKRQEVRITHPYAAYGANGALRCTACSTAIKIASSWEGHLGSKAHRVAVANLKAKEEHEHEHEHEQEGRRSTTGAVSKRKAEDGYGEGEQEQEHMQMATATTTTTTTTTTTKRQRTEEREIAPAANARSTGTGTGTATGASHGAFPANFFSDPTRALPQNDDDDDDDNVEMDQDAKAAAPPQPPLPKSQFDMEWDAFERDLHNLSHQKPSRPPVAAAGGGEEDGHENAVAAAAAADPQETYARATIAAEPELVVSRFEGLPIDDEAQAQTQVQEGGAGVPEEELERRRKERDERELIMDRLMEEERAQEDAYGRVALLKNRIQNLKQKRELAKAKGKKVEETDMQT